MSMGDMFGLMGAIASGPAPTIARDEVTLPEGGSVIVSTVDSYDQGPETAYLCRVDGESQTRIVERYTSPTAAKKGHAKWIKRLKAGERSFTDIGYGVSVDAFEFTLTGESDA